MVSTNLKEKVRQLLIQNTRQYKRSGKIFTFSLPSIGRYPFQWFWDSCFHAIVWTYFDVNRAKEELRALLSAQRENGFIPHIIYWDETKYRRAPWSNHWLETKGSFTFFPFVPKPKTSEFIQPPVIAQAVKRIWQKEKQPEFLLEIVPQLNRYYTWLESNRDPDNDHLLTIIAQYESGLDSLPVYDKVIGFKSGQSALKYNFRVLWILFTNKLLFNFDQEAILKHGPFHVEDVFTNTVYAYNLEILAELNEQIKQDKMARQWSKKARLVSESLIDKCWDEKQKAFFNLNGRKEQRSSVLSVSSLMPIILPWLPKEYVEALIERHLLNTQEFWLPYPVSSVAANEPTFLPDSRLPGAKKTSHWRGSTWINTNWYLVHGLHKLGYHEIADQITEKSHELIEKEGFREYYNPYTGEGIAAHNFGWSTLIIDF